MTIFFNFQITSNHLHSLQVLNCDSNSRLVVDEDDNGRIRIERVKFAYFNSHSGGNYGSNSHLKVDIVQMLAY